MPEARAWRGGRNARRLALAEALVSVLMACSSVGTCEHSYRDPVLVVGSVTGGGSTVLSSVGIADISINGRVVKDLNSLVTPPSFGVSVIEGGPSCQIVCGFGLEEG